MIYCFIADGFEEMEAIAPIDILRRADCNVQVVGIGDQIITGAHDISVCADITAAEIVLDDSLEMIILPGGMPGTLNMEANRYVQAAIDYCAATDKPIAAICAAPSVLGHSGLLKGKNATCFPGFEDQLDGAILSDKLVVTDGKITTAKGAGVAVDFALELLRVLKGEAKAEKLRASMQCR